MAAAVHDVECSLIVADGPRARRLAQVPGLPTLVELDDTLPLADALDAGGPEYGVFAFLDDLGCAEQSAYYRSIRPRSPTRQSHSG